MSLPALVVHGGAGDIPNERARAKLKGVQIAVREGWRILSTGGDPLDAVEAAVKVMEDDTSFNAGTGSVLNLDGEVELDALVMEGREYKAGAVAALRNVQYPVTVARLVMEKTPHVLLAGDGAARFAAEQGIPKLNPGALVTDYERQCLENFKKKASGGPVPGVGTVGAIAVDSSGHVAVAVSTGGTCGKYPGRVGDTPLVGCGGICDDTIGGAVATGHGESITRSCLTSSILNLMEQGLSSQAAAERATKKLTERTKGRAGAIVISRTGDIGVATTTDRISWGSASAGLLRAGIDTNPIVQEIL